MGAHNFADWCDGDTPEEAYGNAVAGAFFEYGHDPYNGTITTTRGFVLIPLNEGESVDEWMDRVIEDNRVQKWENCACVQDPDDPKKWFFAGWAAS